MAFRAGDRVRGAAWFDEIAGAVGTVVRVVEVNGNGWTAKDLLVRFDRPVVIADEPQWTFIHSAHNFEFIAEAVEAQRDMRPLITPRWRDENAQEWHRLWDRNRIDVCPVCHERPDITDGPMNSDVPTRCTHWACVGCWARIAQRDMRCPICRENLSRWLQRYSDSDSDGDEDSESEEMSDEGAGDASDS